MGKGSAGSMGTGKGGKNLFHVFEVGRKRKGGKTVCLSIALREGEGGSWKGKG